MTDTRVVFDFDITFSNGGSLQGHGFRLDIEGDSITDDELAGLVVADLDLLMVGTVEISSKRYVEEPHKRGAGWSFADLSHPIRHGEVTYPGLPAPEIRTLLSREDSRSRYDEGTEFHIGAIDMAANTGTYVDAPFHRYPEGADLAGLPLERLVGVPGVVVDAGERVIGPATFDGVDARDKAVLVRTGWDTRFGRDDYLGEHPYLTAEAASLLAERGAVVVGIDSANIDDTSGGIRPAHTVLLAAGITLVEHLAHLERLPDGPFELFVIPAPVVGMGTFPVRAVARWRAG